MSTNPLFANLTVSVLAIEFGLAAATATILPASLILSLSRISFWILFSICDRDWETKD